MKQATWSKVSAIINQKSKRKSEKNVQAWPRTLLQARTQNFWYIHKPTCLLNFNSVRPGIGMSSVGKFGLPHCNHAGTRFSTFLEINSLVACSTYFRKKNYATWRHPRSKLPHQIDHILTLKTDFCRVVDVVISKPLLDSDHLSVRMKIRIAACFHKKSVTKRPLSKLDSNKLLVDQELRKRFNESLSIKIPDIDHADYDLLYKSLCDVASSTLPKITHPPPDWFSANEPELLKLIEKTKYLSIQQDETCNS